MVDQTRESLAAGDVVRCWMCGMHQHSSQMLPDGGRACDDVRWYCTDPRACTERWVSARHQTYAAGTLPPGSASVAPLASGGRPAASGPSIWQ
jgi:hypothetical protein